MHRSLDSPPLGAATTPAVSHTAGSAGAHSRRGFLLLPDGQPERGNVGPAGRVAGGRARHLLHLRPLPQQGAAPRRRSSRRIRKIALSALQKAPRRTSYNLSLSKERSAPTEGGAGKGAARDIAPTPTRLTAIARHWGRRKGAAPVSNLVQKKSARSCDREHPTS